MKTKVLAALLVLGVAVLASCGHKTCPTYSKNSPAKTVAKSNV